MFVCHCRAVTDTTVRRAVAEGARSIDDLVLSCDAGARCGGCWPALESLIREAEAGAGVGPGEAGRRPAPASFGSAA